MARRRSTHDHSPETKGNGAVPESQERTSDGSRETPAEPQAAETPSPAMQRAEELVDRMAERVGHYTGMIGHNLLWLVTRAREEAEDIWAEAQALRRQHHPEAADTSEEGSP
jgi:hypothetical protein